MDQDKQSWEDVEFRLFQEALEQSTPAEQASFLDRACAGDKRLRDSVEELLSNHRKDDFLESPAIANRQGSNRGSAPEPLSVRGGDTIGRYKLLEQIGEGGFGVVFMAEQQKPVRRKVALKIIKAGMDTRQVIARFEAERQALALMDHPHIAKVLDAGSTEKGRPYFVMELVQGIPITQL